MIRSGRRERPNGAPWRPAAAIVLNCSFKVKGHPAERRYTKLTVIFTGKKRPPVYVLKNGKPVATYPLTQTFDAM